MESEKDVSQELVKQLTERASAEMGTEVASLIPLIISDIVRERYTLELDSFQPKTVKIPLTVNLLSSRAGKVFIGECAWDLRAKRKQPGFPAIEVDLAQPELEFAPTEEESAEEKEEMLTCDKEKQESDYSYNAANLWDHIEHFACRYDFKITRPADPFANLPDANTYIEVYKPETRKWERFCLGSLGAVSAALEYADNPDRKNLVLMEGDWHDCQREVVSFTDESIRKLLKHGFTVMDILPSGSKDGGGTDLVGYIIECELDKDGNVQHNVGETLQYDFTINEIWFKKLKDYICPMALPWGPPKKFEWKP